MSQNKPGLQAEMQHSKGYAFAMFFNELSKIKQGDVEKKSEGGNIVIA